MSLYYDTRQLAAYKSAIGPVDFTEAIFSQEYDQSWSLFGDKSLYKNKKNKRSIHQDNINAFATTVFGKGSHTDPVTAFIDYMDNNPTLFNDCHYIKYNIEQPESYGLAEIVITCQGNIFADGIAKYRSQDPTKRGLLTGIGKTNLAQNKLVPWYFFVPSKDEIVTLGSNEGWDFYKRSILEIGDADITRPYSESTANAIDLHKTLVEVAKNANTDPNVARALFNHSERSNGEHYIYSNPSFIRTMDKMLRCMPLETANNNTEIKFGLAVRLSDFDYIDETDTVYMPNQNNIYVMLDQNGVLADATKLDLCLENDIVIAQDFGKSVIVDFTKTADRYRAYNLAVGHLSSEKGEGGLLATRDDNGLLRFNSGLVRSGSYFSESSESLFKYPPTPATPNAFAEYQDIISKAKSYYSTNRMQWHGFWFTYDFDVDDFQGNVFDNCTDSNHIRHVRTPMLTVKRNLSDNISVYTSGKYRNIYELFRTKEQHEQREQELINEKQKDIRSIWFKVAVDNSTTNLTTFNNNRNWMWVPGAFVNHNGKTIASPMFLYPDQTAYKRGTSVTYPQGWTTPLGANPRQVTGDTENYTDLNLIREQMNEMMTTTSYGMNQLENTIRRNSFFRRMNEYDLYSSNGNRIPNIISELNTTSTVASPPNNLHLLEVQYLTTEETIKDTYCIPPYNNSRLFPGRKTFAYFTPYYRTNNSNRVSTLDDTVNIGPYARVTTYSTVAHIQTHPYYNKVREYIPSSSVYEDLSNVFYQASDVVDSGLTDEMIAGLRSGDPSRILNKISRDTDVGNRFIRLWSMIDFGTVTLRDASCWLPTLQNKERNRYFDLYDRHDGKLLGIDSQFDQENTQSRLYTYVDSFLLDYSRSVRRAEYSAVNTDTSNLNSPLSLVRADFEPAGNNYSTSTIHNSTVRNLYQGAYKSVSNNNKTSAKYRELLTAINDRTTRPSTSQYYGDSMYRIDVYGLPYCNPVVNTTYSYCGGTYTNISQTSLRLIKQPYLYSSDKMLLSPKAVDAIHINDSVNEPNKNFNTKFFVEHLYPEDVVDNGSETAYALRNEFELLGDHASRMGPCLTYTINTSRGSAEVHVPLVRLATVDQVAVLVPYSSHTAMRKLPQNNNSFNSVTTYRRPSGVDNDNYEPELRLMSLTKHKSLGLYQVFGFNNQSRTENGISDRCFEPETFVENGVRYYPRLNNNPDILYAFNHFSYKPTHTPFGALEPAKMTASMYPNGLVECYIDSRWIARAIYDNYKRSGAEGTNSLSISPNDVMADMDSKHGFVGTYYSKARMSFNMSIWMQSIMNRLPFDWVEDLTEENLFRLGPYSDLGNVVKKDRLGLDLPVYDEYNSGHLSLLTSNPDYNVQTRGSSEALRAIFTAVIYEFGNYGRRMLYLYFVGCGRNTTRRHELEPAVTYKYLRDEIDKLYEETNSSSFTSRFSDEQRNRFINMVVCHHDNKVKGHHYRTITDFIATVIHEMRGNESLSEYYQEENWFNGEFNHRVLNHNDVIPDYMGLGQQVHLLPNNRFLYHPAHVNTGIPTGHYTGSQWINNICNGPYHINAWRYNFGYNGDNAPLYAKGSTVVNVSNYITSTGAENVLSLASVLMSKERVYSDRLQAAPLQRFDGSTDLETRTRPIFGWWSVNHTNSTFYNHIGTLAPWDGRRPYNSTELFQSFFQIVPVEIPVDIVIEEPMDAYIVNRLGYHAISTSQRTFDKLVDFSPELIKLVRDEVVRSANGDVELGWSDKTIYETYNPETIMSLILYIQDVAIPTALRKYREQLGLNDTIYTDEVLAAGLVTFGPTAHLRDRKAFMDLIVRENIATFPLASTLNKALRDEGVSLDVTSLKPFNKIMDKHRLYVEEFMRRYGGMFKDRPILANDNDYTGGGKQTPLERRVVSGCTWGWYTVPGSQAKRSILVNEIVVVNQHRFRNSTNNIMQGATYYAPLVSGHTQGYSNFANSYLYRSLHSADTYMDIIKTQIPNCSSDVFDASYYTNCMFSSNCYHASGVIRTSDYYVGLAKYRDEYSSDVLGTYTWVKDFYNNTSEDKFNTQSYMMSGAMTFFVDDNPSAAVGADRYYHLKMRTSMVPLEGVSIYDLFVTEMKYIHSSLGSDEALRQALFNLGYTTPDIPHVGNVGHDPSDIINNPVIRYTKLYKMQSYGLGIWNLTKQRLTARYFGHFKFVRDHVNSERYMAIYSDTQTPSKVADLFNVVKREYTPQQWASRSKTVFRESANEVFDSLTVGHSSDHQMFGSMAHDFGAALVNDIRLGDSGGRLVYHYICMTDGANGDMLYDNRVYYTKSKHLSRHHRDNLVVDGKIHLNKQGVVKEPVLPLNSNGKYEVWELETRDFGMSSYTSTVNSGVFKTDGQAFVSNNSLETTKGSVVVTPDNIPFFIYSTYCKLRDVYLEIPYFRTLTDTGDAVYSICHMKEQVFHPWLYPYGESARNLYRKDDLDDVTNALVPEAVSQPPIAGTVDYVTYVTLLDLAGGFGHLLSNYKYYGNRLLMPYTFTENNPVVDAANWYKVGEYHMAVPCYLNHQVTYDMTASYRLHKDVGLDLPRYTRSSINIDTNTRSGFGNYYNDSRIRVTDGNLVCGEFTVTPYSLVVGQYPYIPYQYAMYNSLFITDIILASRYKMNVDVETVPWVYNNTSRHSLPNIRFGHSLTNTAYGIDGVKYPNHNNLASGGSSAEAFMTSVREINNDSGSMRHPFPLGYDTTHVENYADLSQIFNHMCGDFTDVGMLSLHRAPIGSYMRVSGSNMIEIVDASTSTTVMPYKAYFRELTPLVGKSRITYFDNPNTNYGVFYGSYPTTSSYDRFISNTDYRYNTTTGNSIKHEGWTKPGVMSFGVPLFSAAYYDGVVGSRPYSEVFGSNLVHPLSTSDDRAYTSTVQYMNGFGRTPHLRKPMDARSKRSQYNYPQMQYMLTAPNASYGTYGDWFNYYQMNMVWTRTNTSGFRYLHPTFPPYMRLGKYNGVSDCNFYMDIFTSIDERTKAQYGVVIYPDYGEYVRPFAMMIQAGSELRANNPTRPPITPVMLGFSETETQPSINSRNVTAFSRPRSATKLASEMGGGMGDSTDRIVLRLPEWNIHELGMAYPRRDPTKTAPVHVVLAAADSDTYTYYDGYDGQMLSTKVVEFLFGKLKHSSKPGYATRLNEWNVHVRPRPVGNLFTPHFTSCFTANQDIYHTIREINQDDADRVRSIYLKYFDEKMVDDYNVTFGRHPNAKRIYENETGALPISGKVIPNWIRHTSRTFLNNRYTMYWDYIPLCFKVRGGLYESVISTFNYYPVVWEHRRSAKSYYADGMSGVGWVSMYENAIPVRTSSEPYSFGERQFEKMIATGMWEHLLDSIVFGKKMTKLHEFIANTAVVASETNRWYTNENYLLNLLTFYAMVSDDPSLLGFMGHENPYNTNIVEVEIISMLRDLAKAEVDMSGVRVVRPKSVSSSTDESGVANIIVAPNWTKFKGVVTKHWRTLRKLQPMFSIDNSPVHSMVNEKIRLLMGFGLAMVGRIGNTNETISGYLWVGSNMVNMEAISNISGRHFDGTISGTYTESDLVKDIDVFERYLASHYTIRKMKNKSIPQSYTEMYGNYQNTIFIHVSAYQTVIRLVGACATMKARISRCTIGLESDGVENMNKLQFKTFVRESSTATSNYIGLDYNRFGIISHHSGDYGRGEIPPYYVLRNFIHVKGKVPKTGKQEYNLRIFFYTESTAVKLKDELMMETPSSWDDVLPLKVVDSYYEQNTSYSNGSSVPPLPSAPAGYDDDYLDM